MIMAPAVQKIALLQQPEVRNPVKGSVGNGYQLVQRLGMGSFGAVWQAKAPGGVDVAVKILLRPIDHPKSQRELEVLELIKGIRHPHLVATHAFWEFEDQLHIAMELADCTLRQRAQECVRLGLPGLPLGELMTYMRDACEALDFLHRRHVLHRDIKPDNILVVAGHAKLADLGLARQWNREVSFSATGAGSPRFMSPEQWRGRISVNSDQYSLAATYAELRLNRELFPNASMFELMESHLNRTPDLRPLPPAEQEVVLKALRKEARQRYGTCLEFWSALEHANRHSMVSPDPSNCQK